jgi:hypothetical protein
MGLMIVNIDFLPLGLVSPAFPSHRFQLEAICSACKKNFYCLALSTRLVNDDNLQSGNERDNASFVYVLCFVVARVEVMNRTIFLSISVGTFYPIIRID